MADALVSIALEKLTNVLQQQFTLFAGATPELEELQTTLESIQAVLDDAESRQISEKSVKLWLSRLRHAAYDVEDLLEDGQNSADGGSRNKVCDCLPSPYKSLTHVGSRYKVSRRIKEIRERLDQISDDKKKYGFSDSLGVDRTLVRSRPQTTSLIDELEVIVGREDEKEILISRLVSETSVEDRGQVHVVGLVGFGGLGKTTLARQIYHDSRVKNHFKDGLYWVCVSEVFDVVRITKAIQEQVEETHNFPSELDALQKKLCEVLRGKRFLLILDDVWDDDAHKWEILRLPLLGGAPGSRILVTSRSHKVAETMKAAFTHDLKCLAEDQSWALFSCRAFAGKKADERSQLEDVGKGIAKKCNGVPLSLKVIGSAMNSKKRVEDWQKVLDSETWLHLPKVTDEIIPALFISYINLPPHLKQCFAYCSIFPKDWEIEKEMLVGLWVAQGFIRSEIKEEMEDIGAEYLDDLVSWSMIQQVGTKYIMHDLLHNLAESITKDEIYTRIASDGGVVEGCPGSNVRHAFLFSKGTWNRPSDVPIDFVRAKRLRTLYLCHVYITDSVIADLFREASFLRALLFVSPRFTSDEMIAKLPNDAIGKMKHLRYLNLSALNIIELPESVTHLRNLHTLRLDGCRELKKLPRGIGGMVRLRHLGLQNTVALKCLPKGLGRISCLRSLSKFVVGGGSEGEGCGIDELQQLNSLQGSLEIEHLERISSREEAEKAQLWNKRSLRSLVLMKSSAENENGGMEESATDGLRPPENLEQLELNWYSRSRFPSWTEEVNSESFPNLSRLNLEGSNTVEIRGLGKLPALTSLEIRDVGMKKLGHEFYFGCNGSSSGVLSTIAFPKLEEFSLMYMKELEEWELPTASESSEDDENTSELVDHDVGRTKVMIMPCLCKLTVWDCPKLKGVPHQLKIENCERIEGRSGCVSFPLLEELRLKSSDEFLSNGLPNLPSLKTFKIRYFNKETLPEEGWERLVALQTFQIWACDELRWLPEELTQLHALQKLWIENCGALESLPHSFGELKALKQLIISDCTVLGLRCKREGGEDWPKILHVPNIHIG